MRVTLMHNPTAGQADCDAGTLLAALRKAGYDPVYQSVSEENYLDALQDPGDLVVIGGGDGTVRKVMTHLVEQPVPVAVLPLGTANNIATALGINGTAQELIASLPGASSRRFDVGWMRGPWGEQWFVEGVGLGLFAEMMLVLEQQKEGRTFDEPEDELDHDRRFLLEQLWDFPAETCLVEIDGKEYSDQYLLVEVLNVGIVGPKLHLARQAEPGDGRMEVVLLRGEERDRLGRYLKRCLLGETASFSGTVVRGQQVRVHWESTRVHVDDALCPSLPDGVKPSLEISLGTHALYVLT